MFVGKEEEDKGGNSRFLGDMGEKNMIWNMKATKQSSRKLKNAGMKGFEVLALAAVLGFGSICSQSCSNGTWKDRGKYW